MSSLQIIAFLVSVCHVVVCVQDNLSNPSLLRLINRAILMKPLVLVDDVLLVSHICGTARLLTTAADDAQPKQAKAKEEEVVEEEEPEVETAEDEKEEVENDEAPGSDETGLGQTCAVVRLSTSDSSMADNSATAASAAGSRSRMAQVDEVAEQAE
uniref:Secreted protein n=1 Tax=Mesocestoides corti TaxID=53468 RepID=A0A5K3G840_MESCO